MWHLLTQVTHRTCVRIKRLSCLFWGFNEGFEYDRLDRLTKTNVSGQTGGINYQYAVSQAYDINGNIVNKSDVGDYTYDPNRPQTLLSAGNAHTGYQYDANGSMTAGGGRQIAWSSFNKPTRMLKGDYAVEFHYDADHSRIRKVATVSGVNNTIDYFGKVYEKQTKGSEVNHKHHIYAGGQLVAMHIKQTKAGVQQPDETRYMHRDNLGSIDTITDGRGNVVERLSYDPWGRWRLALKRAGHQTCELSEQPAQTCKQWLQQEHLGMTC